MTTAAEKKAAEEKAATEKATADKKAAEEKAAEKQAADNAARFTTKRKLVMPLLKAQTNVPIYVKPTKPHFTGKTIPAKEGKKAQDPAEVCNVIDLTTGEEVQIIVAAVVQSVWADEYPDDSYVGKGFKITKGVKAAGKQYFQYSVDEIELSK